MAGLRVEKHGNTWRYRFDSAPVDGKRKRIGKSGFRTKGEAIKAGTEAMNEYLNAGYQFQIIEMSMADFLDEWYELNKGFFKPVTLVNYRYQIDHFIKPYIGAYYLNSISPRTIQQLLNNLFQKGLARSSISNIKARLNSAFDWGIQMEYVKNNPVKSCRVPSNRVEGSEKKQRHVYISAEDREKIFKRFEKTPYYLLLMIGYRAGLRAGEALGLCWEDIDFHNGTLTVNRQVQQIGKEPRIFVTRPKYDSVRTFRIDSRLLSLLKRKQMDVMHQRTLYGEYYTNYYLQPDGYLETEPEGKPMNFINVRENGKLLRPKSLFGVYTVVHNELGIPYFDFHSLRKTHCTEMIAGGANPKDVQARLGHKNITETLNVYAEATREMEDQSITVLENMA
jgi:integrase